MKKIALLTISLLGLSLNAQNKTAELEKKFAEQQKEITELKKAIEQMQESNKNKAFEYRHQGHKFSDSVSGKNKGAHIEIYGMGKDWKMKLHNMNPEERKEELKKAEIKFLSVQLKLDEKQKEKFEKIYTEYLDSQKSINDKYEVKTTNELTDAEAKKRLDDSFKNAQELLDNRKKYSKKFLEFLTPNQVLQIFNRQGRFMNKVMIEKLDRLSDLDLPDIPKIKMKIEKLEPFYEHYFN